MNQAHRLHVVHVLHHLVIGGMENGMVNLINRLPPDHFRHTVICIEDYSEFRQRIVSPDVQVHALHRSAIGTWALRWRLLRLLWQLKPDIVHSRNMSGLDALLPARLAGAATLHSEHGFDVDNLHGKARKPALLRRLHSPLVKHYVTVSQHLRQLLVQDVAIAPERISQIYNGVDTDRFTAAWPRCRASLPASFQAEGLFIVGTVGRVRPIKDQATLIRAFAGAVSAHPEGRRKMRLVLVGEGPSLQAHQALAADLGIDDLVWFAGARHDIPLLLQGMDLFVLPSLNEGISNTLLEAMSCGLPVVATAVGGNVELIEPGVVGELFEPGDVKRLAALMGAYASDAALTRAHGVAARERVLQRFSLQSMVASYQSVYQNL